MYSVNKIYYEDYANHCMRYYTRFPDAVFDSSVSAKDWLAVNQSLKEFKNSEKDFLIACYKSRQEEFEKSVCIVAEEYKIKPSYVWRCIRKLQKLIAVNRGLVKGCE